MISSDELSYRLKILKKLSSPCMVCPLRCGADREKNQRGICGGGRFASVAAVVTHYGEEPPISGTRGSGTVFFSGCNLGCLFCQNHQISQNTIQSTEKTPTELAYIFIEVQKSGCHNLNLVTPTHYTYQIVEALLIAVDMGFNLPVVWNSGGYELSEVITVLEGIVDIYLPDFKFMDEKNALKFTRGINYPDFAKSSIETMWKQTGPLRCSKDGIATNGLLCRHLVLPENISSSFLFLEWFEEYIRNGAGISLMSQYNPIENLPEPVNRGIIPDEYYPVAWELKSMNPQCAFIQELSSKNSYNPDFSRSPSEIFSSIK
ncbi:MAG: radical SAM protein [Deltaproteobacteria bacterium]|nr:radical SAM protein [Deltaproteobacteria bacterium]